MTQPEFVINERTMGVMGKDSKGNPKYFEKASFSITLLKHVEAEGQDSGFLSLVKCSITGKDKYVTLYIIVLLATESYWQIISGFTSNFLIKQAEWKKSWRKGIPQISVIFLFLYFFLVNIISSSSSSSKIKSVKFNSAKKALFWLRFYVDNVEISLSI